MKSYFSQYIVDSLRKLIDNLFIDEKDKELFLQRQLHGMTVYGEDNFLTPEGDQNSWKGEQEVSDEIIDAINITNLCMLRSGYRSAIGAILGHLSHIYSLLHNRFHPYVVYIAHPYSDNRDQRIKEVRDIALQVFKRGHIPIVSHLMYHNFDVYDKSLDYNIFLEADLSLIMISDVLLLSRPSPGANIEFLHALNIHKPIIHSIDELPERKWTTIMMSKYSQTKRNS